MTEANFNPQSVLIENSIFDSNYAIYGSALSFSLKILNISSIVKINYFKSNVGVINSYSDTKGRNNIL